MDLIPVSGRSPGGGNGNPLQYSCLGNPMDRGAWWATVQGVTKSWTQLTVKRKHKEEASWDFPLIQQLGIQASTAGAQV